MEPLWKRVERARLESRVQTGLFQVHEIPPRNWCIHKVADGLLVSFFVHDWRPNKTVLNQTLREAAGKLFSVGRGPLRSRDHYVVYRLAFRHSTAKGACRCRPPKMHRDCAYCGMGWRGDGWICGVCKENGIDGRTIPGTARVVCKLHRG